jgi:hypothetical protein
VTINDATLLLTQALAAPCGLVLRASDPQKARQMLYRARREALNPEFDELQIRLVAIGEGNMVICKARVQVPAGTGQKS